MIKISNLEKSYGKSFSLNVKNIDFSGGNIVTLMGPNGSGKTTLLKSILGLVIPDKGEILVNGIDVSRDSSYKNNICFMPQLSLYPPNLRVREVISIIKDIRNTQKVYDLELYEKFEIEKISDKKTKSLSQGTRQRLGAMLAFMFSSGIIILDEPTAGLDPYSSDVLKAKILKERNAGRLILLTTHIVNDVSELSDRLVFMLEGNVKVDKKITRLPGTNGKEFRAMVSNLFKEHELPKNN